MKHLGIEKQQIETKNNLRHGKLFRKNNNQQPF